MYGNYRFSKATRNSPINFNRTVNNIVRCQVTLYYSNRTAMFAYSRVARPLFSRRIATTSARALILKAITPLRKITGLLTRD